MKNTHISFLISILIHSVIIIFLICIRFQDKSEYIPEYVKLDFEMKTPEHEVKPEPPPLPETKPGEKQKPVAEKPPKVEPPQMKEEKPEKEPNPKNSILYIKTREDSLKIWADDLKNYFAATRNVPKGFDVYEFIQIDPEKFIDSLDKELKEKKQLEENFAWIFRNKDKLDDQVDGYQRTKEYIFKRQGGTQTAPLNLLIAAAGKLAKKIISTVFPNNKRKVIDMNMTVFELKIMKIIWKNEFAFPSTVYENFIDQYKPTFSKFKEVLDILESKGLLTSVMDNSVQERVYVPTVTKQEILEYYLSLLGNINRHIKESGDEDNLSPDLNQKKELLKIKTKILIEK